MNSHHKKVKMPFNHFEHPEYDESIKQNGSPSSRDVSNKSPKFISTHGSSKQSPMSAQFEGLDFNKDSKAKSNLVHDAKRSMNYVPAPQ